MKATAPGKKKSQVMTTRGPVDREDDEPVVARVVNEADEADDATEATTAATSEVTAATVETPDSLEIVFLQEVFDNPIIGTFNFQEQFNISRIRRHQKFVVPSHVALTLLDKKLVTIPTMI